MTYKVGVVGLGAVGARMVKNMQTHDCFEPVAGFDTSVTACAALTEIAPKMRSSNDFEALLLRDDIDVLYVCTPPKSHAEFVRHGISKGWNIFCEKPLGVDVADSEPPNALFEPCKQNFIVARLTDCPCFIQLSQSICRRVVIQIGQEAVAFLIDPIVPRQIVG